MVKFFPLNLSFDLSFWAELNRLKLEEWMLEDKPRTVSAMISQKPSSDIDYVLLLDHSSFSQQFNDERISGKLYLFNTEVDFENSDKKKILNDESEQLWKIIENKEWLNNPYKLISFIILAYADLKEFKYRVFSCVPTFASTVGFDYSDPHAFGQFDDFDINNCQYLPCLYSNSNIYSFDSIDKLKQEDIWIILSSIRSSQGQDIVAWHLRNILVAIAFYYNKPGSIKFAVFNGNKYQLSYKVSWTKEYLNKEKFKVVGWNKDERFELKSSFGKTDLMEQSVDLNLKLTRWRMAPGLNIDKFRKRVLILGSGTLGCNISRGLMGWGIRHVTFVDCGNISVSNPVRQSLFSSQDIGKCKAEAAAQSLQNIFPGMTTIGVNMKIPMPGHPTGSETSEIVNTIKQLIYLINDHDIIFLATDSRESRWLPTLVCAALEKLAITVALGFDSFLVLRHGYGKYMEETKLKDLNIRDEIQIPGSQLGCYFCLDVTAPGNSTINRTLDQQCTISRSGISQVACGIAVELVASLLQKPEGANAAAKLIGTDESAGPLGATPHQIRGFLSSYNFMTATVKRSTICSACGEEVVGKFGDIEEFVNFIISVLNNPRELENICGLARLQADAIEIEDSIMPFSDDEST